MRYPSSGPAFVRGHFPSSLGVSLWTFIVLFLLLPLHAFAVQLTFAWDANTESTLVGYKIYYGAASRDYAFSVDIGNYTTAALSGLDAGTVYYFAATAYDIYGNESGLSAEVMYDPWHTDTDGDGLSDWDEVYVYGTDPTRADTDGDGLSDGDEVKTYKTDPKRADTDGDGFSDGEEIKLGFNPLAATSKPTDTLTDSVIPQSQLSIEFVDSDQVPGYDAENAIDGQATTMWHTQWVGGAPRHPHTLVIGLGGAYLVQGLRYLPRQDTSLNGTVAKYEIYVSEDGVNWGAPVATGTFAADRTQKEVGFSGKEGRFVSFVALSEVNGKPWTSAAEINLLGTPADSTGPQAIPQSQLSIEFVDSDQVPGYDAENAIDGQATTMWHTQWVGGAPRHPHTLVIGLGGAYLVQGLRYLPRQDTSLNGTVAKYEIYVSEDGVNWGAPVATGTFAADRTQKEVGFSGKEGRFVSFIALSEVNGKPWTSAAEINLLGTPAQ